MELKMNEDIKEETRHVYYIEGIPAGLGDREVCNALKTELFTHEAITMKQIDTGGYVVTSRKELCRDVADVVLKH